MCQKINAFPEALRFRAHSGWFFCRYNKSLPVPFFSCLIMRNSVGLFVFEPSSVLSIRKREPITVHAFFSCYSFNFLLDSILVFLSYKLGLGDADGLRRLPCRPIFLTSLLQDTLFEGFNHARQIDIFLGCALHLSVYF